MIDTYLLENIYLLNLLLDIYLREHEFLVIPLRAKLEEEEYTLVIEYEAEVRHALKGFYRSYYTTSSGEKR